MRAALERHGGTVEKFIGDAVMAVFGLPVRHEDDAVRAVRAAADMQAALAASTRLPGPARARAVNHIGVNTGEVIAGDAALGPAAGHRRRGQHRRATRAGCRPGEVVLGDLTYRLARDQIEVEFMAPLELKGKAEPVAGVPARSASIGPARRAGRPDAPSSAGARQMDQLEMTLLEVEPPARASW